MLLSPEQLEELRRISSPTIANAIETFEVRARMEGVTGPGVQCLFPQHGGMIGYASTLAIHSNQPPAKQRRVNRKDYWESMRKKTGPLVAVAQDLSETAGGAYWGDVNSHIHQKLGCVGVLTNGAVRDLDEVGRMAVPFHFMAASVTVSHGWAHLEDFDCPVKVFGMLVRPGDLIHADRHGAVIIPAEIADRVAAAARKVEADEKPMLDLCRASEMDLDALDKLISAGY
ncbi:MAG: RraA family protein [Bryobacteraceae bacterium]